MERVLGIGGIFFKARDPQELAAWYEKHLGVPLEAGQSYATFRSGETGEQTTVLRYGSRFPPMTTAVKRSRAFAPLFHPRSKTSALSIVD